MTGRHFYKDVTGFVVCDVAAVVGCAEARAPRRIRTADPFITNEVLYQLSYWGYASRRLNGRGASRKDEKSSRCCFCGLPVDLLVEAAEVDGQFEHEHIEAGVAEREELLTLLSPEMCCDWH